jgi:hypothetical protein
MGAWFYERLFGFYIFKKIIIKGTIIKNYDKRVAIFLPERKIKDMMWNLRG